MAPSIRFPDRLNEQHITQQAVKSHSGRPNTPLLTGSKPGEKHPTGVKRNSGFPCRRMELLELGELEELLEQLPPIELKRDTGGIRSLPREPEQSEPGRRVSFWQKQLGKGIP